MQGKAEQVIQGPSTLQKSQTISGGCQVPQDTSVGTRHAIVIPGQNHMHALCYSCYARPVIYFPHASQASSASGSEGSSVSGSSSSNNFLLQRRAQQPSCGPPSQSRAHRASPAPFRGSSAPLSASSDSAGIREALRVPLHHKDEVSSICSLILTC